MQDPNQLDLDFHAPAGNGYAAWEWDRQEAVCRVAAEWGLPIGRQVRLRRQGIDGDFEGKLELASLPARIDRRTPLELRIGKMQFPSTEVEACSAVAVSVKGESINPI